MKEYAVRLFLLDAPPRRDDPTLLGHQAFSVSLIASALGERSCYASLKERSHGDRAAEWQPFNTPRGVLTKVSLILTQRRQQAMMSHWMASIAPRAAGPRVFNGNGKVGKVASRKVKNIDKEAKTQQIRPRTSS